jgi:hypothetical protein
MSNNFSPSVHYAVITVLEFIRHAVESYPKTTDHILTAMDLSDAAFDEEIDVLENMLAAGDENHERMVPRLAEKPEEED